MTAHLIHSPTDFQSVLSFHDFAVWNLTHYPADLEPKVREQLDYIFTDLRYMEAGDAEQMSVFLETIADPLMHLLALGCQIMAIVSRGTMRLEGGAEIDNWVRTHYFIVPINGSFRIGEDLTSPIHHFNPRCPEAVTALQQAARDGLTVSSWMDDRSLTVDYEGRVPWCAQCLVESMGSK